VELVPSTVLLARWLGGWVRPRVQVVSHVPSAGADAEVALLLDLRLDAENGLDDEVVNVLPQHVAIYAHRSQLANERRQALLGASVGRGGGGGVVVVEVVVEGWWWWWWWWW
jgi:hypothetical protein